MEELLGGYLRGQTEASGRVFPFGSGATTYRCGARGARRCVSEKKKAERSLHERDFD
jgi:hypothetical protein